MDEFHFLERSLKTPTCSPCLTIKTVTSCFLDALVRCVHDLTSMALCVWNSVLEQGFSVYCLHGWNWMSKWPIKNSHGDCRDPEKYCWNSQDFELVKSASFIFAADVIYSDDLTIDVTQIPEYVKGYDRGEDVELWEIRCVH